MIFRLCLHALLVLTAATARATAAEPPATQSDEPKVECLSLWVGGAKSSGSFKVATQIHVTNVGGVITGPEYPLTLKKFSDDRGTNLVDLKDHGFPTMSQAALSNRGDSMVISLAGFVNADVNAKKIIIDGVAHLRVGKNIKTGKSNGFRLRVGQEFSAGAAIVKVGSLGDCSDKFAHKVINYDTIIGLSCDNPEKITAIRLFDKDNKIIGSGRFQMARFASAAHTDASVSHLENPIFPENRAPQQPTGALIPALKPGKDVNLEVDYCEKLEIVDVPIHLEIPIGSAPSVSTIDSPLSYDYNAAVKYANLENNKKSKTMPAGGEK